VDTQGRLELVESFVESALLPNNPSTVARRVALQPQSHEARLRKS
jgi:hypothetical protein